jgi:multiple sugar transport system permease protein
VHRGRVESGWWFAAFPLAVIFLFTALPTAFGAGLSLFAWDGAGGARFVGLQNFQVAAARDPQFGAALRNTLVFTVATVPVTVVGAFLFAVAMHARWFVGRTLARTLFFLPTVVSIVALGYIWRWVLDPHAGLLRYAMEAVGIPGDAVPPLLGDSPWALAALMFIHAWRQLGFCVVLYLAALAGVPPSLYEAASVDGAGSWRATWSIAWPSVRPMTMFLLVTSGIAALQVFDLVWVMTGGAPQRWTDVLNTHLYREFTAGRLGYAATIGVIVLALTAVITAAQFRVFGERSAVGR